MQYAFDPKDCLTAITKGEVQTTEITPEEIRAYFDGEELPEDFSLALDAAQGEFSAGRDIAAIHLNPRSSYRLIATSCAARGAS